MQKTNYWFFSDPHYDHKNICAATSEWTEKDINCRNFSSLDEMNKKLVEEINAKIGINDVAICLGDFSFNGIENLWNFRKQIKCENLWLVLGNHDEKIRDNKTLPNCHWNFTKNKIEDGAPKNFDEEVSAMDLFQLIIPQGYIFSIEKDAHFVLSHYPWEQWEEMNHGYIHLHGHTHGKLDKSELNTTYRRFDVSVYKDGVFHIYSYDELKHLLLSREIKKRNYGRKDK